MTATQHGVPRDYLFDQRVGSGNIVSGMSVSTRVVVVGTLLWLGPQSGQSNIVRIGTYNTFNNPDNTTADAWFATIFDGISNKTINDTATRIDLLAVAETDTGSAARLPSILNDIYGVSSYEVITSSPDG